MFFNPLNCGTIIGGLFKCISDFYGNNFSSRIKDFT
jgi:hypothetical protein